MKLLVLVADIVFGCRHPQERRSWPRHTAGIEGVYQVCLECGKTLPYNKGVFPKEISAQ